MFGQLVSTGQILKNERKSSHLGILAINIEASPYGNIGYSKHIFKKRMLGYSCKVLNAKVRSSVWAVRISSNLNCY